FSGVRSDEVSSTHHPERSKGSIVRPHMKIVGILRLASNDRLEETAVGLLKFFYERPPMRITTSTTAFFCSLSASSLGLNATAFTAEQPGAGGPAFEWRTAMPEDQGISSRQPGALKDDLAARNTKTFLVVHDDRIIYEWYAA